MHVVPSKQIVAIVINLRLYYIILNILFDHTIVCYLFTSKNVNNIQSTAVFMTTTTTKGTSLQDFRDIFNISRNSVGMT